MPGTGLDTGCCNTVLREVSLHLCTYIVSIEQSTNSFFENNWFECLVYLLVCLLLFTNKKPALLSMLCVYMLWFKFLLDFKLVWFLFFFVVNLS